MLQTAQIASIARLWQKEILDNMSRPGYIPPQLGEADLRKLLSEALDSAPDSNPETYHSRFGHLERDLSVDDVIYGLERPWKFERAPQFNRDEWQWKYRIATNSIEGDPIVIIVAVDTANRSFQVITRWR
jgi:hypothetical protein